MHLAKQGWQLGGYVGSRLALVYALLAGLCFYLQVGVEGGFREVWRADRLVIVSLLGEGVSALLLAPLLVAVPISLAWLAGSVAGFLTSLLTWLFTRPGLARLWGMFCFSIPPLIFHTAADLRPHIMPGEHWLNSYWFWVGLPTVLSVLIGGWVGEHLAGQDTSSILTG